MTTETTPSRRAELRDQIAAALEAAEYRRDMQRGDLADAVLPVLYQEWPWLRAEAEGSEAAKTQQTTGPAENLAQELHRRATRLEELRLDLDSEGQDAKQMQVAGEVIGLRGALGVVLGGTVQGGSADRLGSDYYRAWLDRSKEGQAGVREVRIRVSAPTGENAGQWAQTIADLVVAEHGQEMRLDITISTPGPSLELPRGGGGR